MEMEDNDEIAVSDEMFNEIDEVSVKIEQQIDQDAEEAAEKYFDFNLEVNDFLETKNSKPILVKLNKQPLNTKLQPQVLVLHSYNSNVAGRNLVPKYLVPKYRPIRPKPSAGGDKSGKMKNKLLVVPAALNVSAPSRPNRVIANGNAAGVHDKNGTHAAHDKNRTHATHDKNGTHGILDKNHRHSPKKIKPRATIELFFDSMAQSVSKLPAEVQAEIKMEICKLVTRAEIKHYGSQPK